MTRDLPLRDRAALLATRYARIAVAPFILAVIVLYVWVLGVDMMEHAIGWDFLRAYRPAADDVLHGRSPFPQLTLLSISKEDKYVYPPTLAAALIPFTLVPKLVAVTIFETVSAVAFLAIPWMLGVRDRRVLFALLLWPCLAFGLGSGTVSPLIAVIVALVWRWRDRVVPVGLAVAAAIAAKLYLAPLAVWLLFTRRVRAALLAGAASIALLAGTWAMIGFAGLRDYPRLVSLLSESSVGYSLGPAGTLHRFGLSVAVASAIALVLAAILVAAAIALCLRGAEVAAFCAVIGASLAGSPLVWHHYLAVLVVPIAIVSRRLEPLWFLPALTFVSMTNRGSGPYHRDLFVEGVVALTLWRCARRDPAFAAAAGAEIHAFPARPERDTLAECETRRAS